MYSVDWEQTNKLRRRRNGNLLQHAAACCATVDVSTAHNQRNNARLLLIDVVSKPSSYGSILAISIQWKSYCPTRIDSSSESAAAATDAAYCKVIIL
jgi:hypothetical protein